MSPTQMALMPAPYIPTSDAMDRHEYGVSKNRKNASTGGGRAWSEDEELYLLQTRLQKMPYKHIAAHLKKTELACRLHYHQLSHGSNRRKRAASCSSSSSHHSPMIGASTTMSPERESMSRSVSPPGSSASSYGPPGIQLPSILTTGTGPSPKLPAILPKPASMALPPPPAASGYVAQLDSSIPAPSNPGYHHQLDSHPVHRVPHDPSTPPLRLDCSGLPPPSTATHGPAHVDLARLHAIYSAHRAAFWEAIAHEYGPHVSPSTLEQAWKSGSCCSQQGSTPITPVSSPDNADKDMYSRSRDKTRISSILGIDADPRTARDRDIVRRMEEERFGVMQSAV